TNTLVFTVKQAGYSRTLLEALLTESLESIIRFVDLPPHCSPNLKALPHHHHLKFKLPSQPTPLAALPPTSMGPFFQSACHLAGRVSFQIVNLILPAPIFKYLTSFSLPLQLRRQIPEGPARPAVCLPLLLCPLHQLGGRGGGPSSPGMCGVLL
ncbi:unnamed protein product, partial [Rangifer tarandus platyrhynchus]